MSAKNKGAKGAKAKQRAEKAKPVPATKLIPELAAMNFPAKMVAKLEALAEADQDTVLNYVNSGMKINWPKRFRPRRGETCSNKSGPT